MGKCGFGVILASLLVLLSMATPTSARVLVEAENFVNSYNAGGDEIIVVTCSAASGGFAVEGFDAPGDWIEIGVTVPETYLYVDSLRSAGDLDVQSGIGLTVFGASPGGSDVTSGYRTVGLGIG